MSADKAFKAFNELLSQAKAMMGTRAKKTISALSNLENEIRAEISRIDDEKQAIKEAEARARAEEFRRRTDILFNAGFSFDGIFYRVGTYQVEAEKVLELSPEALERLAKNGKAEADRIAAILTAATTTEEPGDGESAPKDKPLLEKKSWMFPGKIEPIESAQPVRSEQVEPVYDSMPAGFAAGFESAKIKLLEWIDRPDKFTRDQLRDFIVNLQPDR